MKLLRNKKIIFTLVIILLFSCGTLLKINTSEIVAQSSTTRLSGYAWSDTIGWISFASSTTNNNSVTVDSNGYLNGYAWSENIGWVKFGGLASQVISTITSTPAGETWSVVSPLIPEASKIKNWSGVAYSGNGSKFAVVGHGTQIYTSSDNGVKLIARDSTRYWYKIASSDDGTKLAAITNSFGSGRVYISNDSGATWTQTSAPNNQWAGIAMSANGTKIIAASISMTSPYSDGKIYISNDSGSTWTPVNSAPLNVSRSWYDVTSSDDGQKLAAVAAWNGANDRIYTSSDGGTTWVARGPSSAWWNSITSSDDGTKLAATISSGQIYTSSDSGVTWTARDSNRAWQAITSSGDGTKLAAVEYHASNGTGRIYISTNSGVNWSVVNTAPVNVNKKWRNISISDDGTKLAATAGWDGLSPGSSNDTVYVSNNGGTTWSQIGNLYRKVTNLSIVAASSDGQKMVTMGATGRPYRTTDAGINWTEITTVPTSLNWRAITSTADGTKLAAVAYGGQIYTSTDSGVTWTARASNKNWRAIASSDNGTKLAAVVLNDQIYTSTDSGVTWTARDANRAWSSITSSSDGTKLAAAVANGQIYTSTDSGVTWTARDSNRAWVYIASSADGTKLVAAEGWGKIYTSTDSGVTWTARSSNRPWSRVYSSAEGTKLAATISTSGQVYVSLDTGVTWNPMGPNQGWTMIDYTPDFSKAFYAQGGDVYISNATGTTAVNQSVTDARYQNNMLSGWARACSGTVNKDCNSSTRTDGWDGWISLSGNGYGLNFNENGESVSPSYAWGSDVVGWIDFSQVRIGDQIVTDGVCSFNGEFVQTMPVLGNLCSGGIGQLDPNPPDEYEFADTLNVGDFDYEYTWYCRSLDGGNDSNECSVTTEYRRGETAPPQHIESRLSPNIVSTISDKCTVNIVTSIPSDWSCHVENSVGQNQGNAQGLQLSPGSNYKVICTDVLGVVVAQSNPMTCLLNPTVKEI